MENAIPIYGIYCRKSSESEDRQVLSLDSQVEKAREIAKAFKVKIPEEHVFSEARSAKTTNHRPAYAEMLSAVEHGKINAIITWHADRLSRNAIDTALLIDFMDKGKLLEIVTPGQTFRNSPMDKFMLSLACSQAKMENDKKGIDVKRGLQKKAAMGSLPNLAPIGYLNDKFKAKKGEKSIYKDPDRFVLVRKMWDLMLTGTSNPQAIRRIATEEWGLRTKNGKVLAYSSPYWIFTNSFYCGTYEFPRGSGNWYEGAYEPMVTREEFDRVQVLLGKKGRPRPKTQIFEFTGMATCGECGAAITAELKTKHQQNGNVHTYVYYHCTKRRDPNCPQGSIEVNEWKRQVVAELERIEIPPEFHDFGMKWLRSENSKEAEAHDMTLKAQQSAYNKVVAKLDNLIDMRAAGEISPQDFAEKQETYLAEKSRLKDLLDRTDAHVEQWNRSADEMLTFIEQAVDRFKSGSLQVKREILSTLGSNLTLKDKKLSLDVEKCILPMQKVSAEVRKIKARLEPPNSNEKQRDFEQSCSENPILLRWVEDVRTCVMT